MYDYTNATTTFQEMDNDNSYFMEQVRDEVASLLSEALKSCQDDRRASLVDKATTIYESLEAMRAILRHTAAMANQHHGFVIHRNNLPAD